MMAISAENSQWESPIRAAWDFFISEPLIEDLKDKQWIHWIPLFTGDNTGPLSGNSLATPQAS